MARGKKATGKSDQPAEAMVEKGWIPPDSSMPKEPPNIFRKREIPAGRVFELRGKNSGTVLHNCITTKCSRNLLEGISTKYPDLLEVGESTETVIDGMRFNLVRTA